MNSVANILSEDLEFASQLVEDFVELNLNVECGDCSDLAVVEELQGISKKLDTFKSSIASQIIALRQHNQ